MVLDYASHYDDCGRGQSPLIKQAAALLFLDGVLPNAASRNLQLMHVTHPQIYSWPKVRRCQTPARQTDENPEL